MSLPGFSLFAVQDSVFYHCRTINYGYFGTAITHARQFVKYYDAHSFEFTLGHFMKIKAIRQK